MENPDRGETDNNSNEIIIDVPKQEELLRKAKELNPKSTVYDSYSARELLGKELVTMCRQRGNCTFILKLFDGEGMFPLVDRGQIAKVLSGEKGFIFKQLDDQPVPGHPFDVNPRGVHFQREPEIKVSRITYKNQKVFLEKFSLLEKSSITAL
jgi:hypothetical protein